MLIVNDVVKRLNTIAPFHTAQSYDNVGLLVGDSFDRVRKGIVCLDITADVVDEAKHIGANLIISHHPVIFDPIKSVTRQSSPIVFDMIKHNISAIAAHTNLDVANGGVNDALFKKLKLSNKMPLNKGSENDTSIGSVGELDEYMSPDEFAVYVKECLSANGVRYTIGDRLIKTVAVCCGSGGDELHSVLQGSIDAFVTGDVKHNIFIDAENNNFTLVDAGHFATEAHIVYDLVMMLNDYFDDYIFKVAKSGDEKVRYI